MAQKLLFSTSSFGEKYVMLCAGLFCSKYTFPFSESAPCGFTTSEEKTSKEANWYKKSLGQKNIKFVIT